MIDSSGGIQSLSIVTITNYVPISVNESISFGGVTIIESAYYMLELCFVTSKCFLSTPEIYKAPLIYLRKNLRS